MAKTIFLIWIFVMGIFAGEKAIAKAQITLLTSLQPSEGSGFINGRDFDNNKAIEKVFRSRLGMSGFAIKVVHKARLPEIWEALHDPDNVAVFFVGHAAASAAISKSGVVQAESIIADYEMANVKDAFQSVHDQLRYLAIVGCEAAALMEGFKAKDYYQNAKNLKIKAFAKPAKAIQGKIDLSGTSGLDEAIDEAAPILGQLKSYNELFPNSDPCQSNEVFRQECEANYVARQNFKISQVFDGWPLQNSKIELDQSGSGEIITIVRKVPAGPEVHPVLVLWNKQVRAFFPPMPAGLAGEQTQTISAHNLPREGSEVSIVSGIGSSKKKSEMNLGEFFFYDSAGNNLWVAEKSKSGNILGVGTNYYRFQRPEFKQGVDDRFYKIP